MSTRRRAEVQAAFAVVRPLALFLPVGLLGIWLIVRSGLTPIRRFCGAIAARGRNDLTPLDKGGLPAEIAPGADAGTELMARLDRARAAERLTPFERELLVGIAEGASDKEIGRRLDTSAHNVDYHLRKLRKRFGVANRIQLTYFASARGLI